MRNRTTNPYYNWNKNLILDNIFFILLIILLCLIIIIGTCKITGICKEPFNNYDPKIQELINIITPIFNKNNIFINKLKSLNNRNILSEVNINVGRKSYTLNKKNVFLCLKDEQGQYYDDNTLIYVLLHEIAHVINTKSIGHDRHFHNTFKELLDLATEKNIYNPNIPVVSNYCP